ncbi:uncharacterized protein EV420DRAFT_1270489 [Desarmillaria tabescens]|uniref:Uncharacterized protein n=1 Tax=Armillaria tabescens TaxID=1929756 RepID=A0AA39KBY3_ARMTA|nr:uncharacterized protein EV420DRAFT_1270489 [Desarmillaria tabescens]KAK0458339.1 hypothetical protein EV420DRAFT_1270489 [Desarmillaria tabescens]
MYWGAAKYHYRSSPRTTNIDEMEKNMIACLDDVPHLQIIRYANRSARFISAYYYGLSGVDAVWAARKYAGHRILPLDILADIREFVESRERSQREREAARK